MSEILAAWARVVGFAAAIGALGFIAGRLSRFWRGGIVKHEPTNILWLNGQRQMSEDIIALRHKIAALEMPETQPTEAEFVGPHVLRAQRLAITCLTRALEVLTAAMTEVHRDNDPT